MYLRWQYRIPRRRTALGRAIEAAKFRPPKRQPALVAVVVESRRLDGKPRQRLVAYLGSIRRDEIHRVGGRHKFWTRVDERLAGFPPEDRERLAAAVEVLVARPTTEEIADLTKPTEEMVRRAAAIEAARARIAAFRAARANEYTSAAGGTEAGAGSGGSVAMSRRATEAVE